MCLEKSINTVYTPVRTAVALTCMVVTAHGCRRRGGAGTPDHEGAAVSGMMDVCCSRLALAATERVTTFSMATPPVTVCEGSRTHLALPL
eukprot:COSAG05_NODE_2079_length_3603_cov_2.777968_3_plen_90_part_00